MTPDALHTTFVVVSFLALPALVLASLVLHRRVGSRWSACLLAGLSAVLAGQALQIFSPVDELSYEEFRGIVVSSGALPLQWYAGSLLSSAGLLVCATGALGLAFTTARASPRHRSAGAR